VGLAKILFFRIFGRVNQQLSGRFLARWLFGQFFLGLDYYGFLGVKD
jgi:hypothetical protein